MGLLNKYMLHVARAASFPFRDGGSTSFVRAGSPARARIGSRARRGSRSHEKARVMCLLSEIGLRCNENASAAGAQTERRGGTGPVSVLLRLRGWDSPAAFHHASTIR